ncbi:hypothetical protein [Bradyrhizobium ganzhouense]|uniref:hypothetical protein n=1 Tax=Bradyrhizobium ganzhouense TaxID=1179767 RepID=UPI003CF040CD
MLFGLEDIFGRAQHLAATDKVASAKLVLNDSEIDIQDPVHAMVPPTNRQQPLAQPDCPDIRLLPYRAALHTSIDIAITIVASPAVGPTMRLIAEKANGVNSLSHAREDGIASAGG